MNYFNGNNRAEVERLLKVTKPDISFKIQCGDTILINPLIYFYVNDEESLDEIRFLVNDYVRYDKKLYELSINKKISSMVFRQQGFILKQAHNSSELIILQNSAQSVCDEASKTVKKLQIINNNFADVRFDFGTAKNEQATISGRWGTRDGVEGFAENVYKHNPDILKSI